jgi:hypothetical protein
LADRLSNAEVVCGGTEYGAANPRKRGGETF